MSKIYTNAQFWKCALQVNPASYIEYRGKNQRLSEDEYNQRLLEICLAENIKVIGIADHGNVDAIKAISKLFGGNDITVFPGFEIASSEKVHFVCLFPESTTKTKLNRYLGNLELTDPEDGVRPSRFGGEQLLTKVEELGGVCYAAHVTHKSGLLLAKLNHIWKSPLLKAAQIPGARDNLPAKYKQIIENKNPDYKRSLTIAVINASDIAPPEDLKKPNATCMIKMTKPCFESFKQAFLDPESRVRLNSEIPQAHYSRIESLKFIGGYLDEIEIELSQHLNTVIGGRGTGKSTLIELLRYVLELTPTGKSTKTQHRDIVEENLGKEKGRVEVIVRSGKMHGRRYIISRRHGEKTVVKDIDGTISSLTSHDLLPRIEIYGQNEIYEIAQYQSGQFRMIQRFLEVDNRNVEKNLKQIKDNLQNNRKKILAIQDKLADIQEDVAKLPKLEEQKKQYQALDLDERLKDIPNIETEKHISQRVIDEIKAVQEAIITLRKSLPDIGFLADKAISSLPHKTILKRVRKKFRSLKTELEKLLLNSKKCTDDIENEIEEVLAQLDEKIKSEEATLTKEFKKIPDCEGRSGKEIGTAYQKLLRQIERIKPLKSKCEKYSFRRDDLIQEREALLAELSEKRTERSAQMQRALKKINKKLKGKLKLKVETEANREPLIDYLLKSNLEGIGVKRLSWINEAVDFAPVKLSQLIKNGVDDLKSAGWGITTTVADGLSRLPPSRILEMQELELPDTVTIELNVSHEGKADYRGLNRLSIGQQCTAILHLLLLENKDPLIVDQPEDNLDNAFIAERIVTELRSAKIGRQFIFATHNANIPVFGDAEWIGVMSVEEGKAVMPAHEQGAIDLPEIQKKAADILEGGRAAFIQRKDKYGY